MANVGGQPDNKNSSKSNRLWAETIRRAVTQADGKKLRAIADKLIEKAADGDIQAIKELGDRLDGRAVQAVEQKTELSGLVEVAQRPQLTKEEWLKAFGGVDSASTAG